jgi:hypothetical protein
MSSAMGRSLLNPVGAQDGDLLDARQSLNSPSLLRDGQTDGGRLEVYDILRLY